MGFIRAVASGFRKYFTFSGRALRSEYWYWALFVIIASIIAQILDSSVLGYDGAALDAGMERAFSGGAPVTMEEYMSAFGPLAVLVSLGTFIPSFAVLWRRLHDVNKSGWFGFLPCLILIVTGVAASLTGIMPLMALGGIIAILSFIYLLYLLVTRGTPGANRFGPEPH